MRALVAGLLLLVACGSTTAEARRVPWRKGDRFTYRAPGGTLAIQIVILGNPNTGPCQASLREGKKVLWERRWAATPGTVTVSQAAEYLCALNYSNWDEHWYRGVSFYDRKGELLKEIEATSELRAGEEHRRRTLREGRRALLGGLLAAGGEAGPRDEGRAPSLTALRSLLELAKER
jgi:hypothetical protein